MPVFAVLLSEIFFCLYPKTIPRIPATIFNPKKGKILATPKIKLAIPKSSLAVDEL